MSTESTSNGLILVSNGCLPKTSAGPPGTLLLYEFANSLDERRFVQGGVPHMARDGFASAALLAWMRSHGLLERGARLGRDDHEKAMELRGALRNFLRLDV